MADINILNSEQVPSESENKLNTKLLGLYTDENNNDTSLQWTPVSKFATQSALAMLQEDFDSLEEDFGSLHDSVTTPGFPFTILPLKDTDFYHAQDSTTGTNYFQVNENDSYQIKLPIGKTDGSGNGYYLVYERLRLTATHTFTISDNNSTLIRYKPQDTASGLVRYCYGLSGLDAVGSGSVPGVFGTCSTFGDSTTPNEQKTVQFGIKLQNSSSNTKIPIPFAINGSLVISGWRIGFTRPSATTSST